MDETVARRLDDLERVIAAISSPQVHPRYLGPPFKSRATLGDENAFARIGPMADFICLVILHR
ncbi:MAG: hypothetical protein E5X49_26230 [Mesorhizobium sp.]|uniref:hypothetical protein n=1 Tax=Mesorhizobium sp. TaxID=1871066 RepID=UPI00122547A8|nr:hypothetical protein [Mesorhizobium sp.]TIQ39785.1 MAG: hypothetical protein E5X49_26230 [Mesorhizobium sp.]